MLEARGTVVRVEGSHAFVRAERQSACGTCGEQGSCGTGSLSKILGNRENLFEVDNPVHAHTGEQVTIGFQEGVFLRIVAVVYLLPIALFALGAILGTAFSEPAAIGGGIAGLALGLLAVREINQRVASSGKLMPIILDRDDSPSPTNSCSR